MNPVSLKEAEKIFSTEVKPLSLLNMRKTEVIVFPPFVYLGFLKKLSGKISIGGQNVFAENPPYGTGAHTGEISAEMLYGLGARYVILGHSERRALTGGGYALGKFADTGERNNGETNLDVNKKIKSSLSSGLKVIVCVGESTRDENHEYLDFIKKQIEEGLEGISGNSLSKIIIAYEPIWAIGKGAIREATPAEFREMKIFIKKVLSDKFSPAKALGVRILYGGSVNPKNSLGFLTEGQADGFLVGRDSLKPKQFVEIVKNAESVK